MPTDMSEKGLEKTIVDYLVNNNGYELGNTTEFNKDYALDEGRLFRFLSSTQESVLNELHILDSDIERRKFLEYLSNKLSTEGIIALLRNGLPYLHKRFDLFFVPPTGPSDAAAELYSQNIFSVTRQLKYSKSNTNSIDFVIFINGLPVATFELKNNVTKQSTDDAVEQYKNDRDPKTDPTALILKFKRCIVHFAMDENSVKMCTELKGKASWFLPFNKGYNNGAGNPPKEKGVAGYKTDYLWEIILTKSEFTNIILNYTQVIEEKVDETKKKKYKQIFPRFHQLSVVKELLHDAQQNGTGQKYLIQHSAGSGKSNSIAWLAHQLVSLRKDGKEVFDSIIVVTDRINLDTQIRNTIKNFAQVKNVIGWATSSGDLKKLLADGKKIIITLIHKFQYILDDISSYHQGNTFAIIIDEAHSSQNGSLSAKMNIALSGSDIENEADLEDKINTIIEGRKLMKNASYFAFTATPKNKTLQMFGVPYRDGDDIKYRPFHTYTMKQAIEEGFILDVLRYYTSVRSYYNIIKTVENDPEFDRKKGAKKLRYFVESNTYTIQQKADFIVEHFHSCVISKGKINGQARAMVVTGSIQRAIDYHYAILKALEARNSQYKSILAFSGEKEHAFDDGTKITLTEEKANGFPSSQIEKQFKKDPYRILVVADKFQTGFDEPLLHTMYVDKNLSDIKAVQTLSRLNRAYPNKVDTFVVDFFNDPETIQAAFSDYYTTTILSGETDVNKLNDLIMIMVRMGVYGSEQINQVVSSYLCNVERSVFEPVLNDCVENYNELQTCDMIEFKSAAKNFVRTYNFLAAILPYGSEEWEKLSIFLTLLLPKLPSPPEDDLAVGLLESIDLDSYRLEAQNSMRILLDDSDTEVDPVPVSTGGGVSVPDMVRLSDIITMFLEQTGSLGKQWTDADKVRKHIEDISAIVLQDEAYQNAILYSDAENARDESNRALRTAVQQLGTTMIELWKAMDDPSIKKLLEDTVFNMTYKSAR